MRSFLLPLFSTLATVGYATNPYDVKDNCLQIWEDPGYSGSTKTLCTNSTGAFNSANNGFDNNISSIVVGTDLQVQLCVYSNCGSDLGYGSSVSRGFLHSSIMQSMDDNTKFINYKYVKPDTDPVVMLFEDHGCFFSFNDVFGPGIYN
jgi:hypothetical protein